MNPILKEAAKQNGILKKGGNKITLTKEEEELLSIKQQKKRNVESNLKSITQNLKQDNERASRQPAGLLTTSQSTGGIRRSARVNKGCTKK